MSVFHSMKIVLIVLILVSILFVWYLIDWIEQLHISKNFHSHTFVAGLLISYINLYKFDSGNTVKYKIPRPSQIKEVTTKYLIMGIIFSFLIWSFHPVLPYPKFWLILAVYFYYLSIVISLSSVYYLQRHIEGKIF